MFWVRFFLNSVSESRSHKTTSDKTNKKHPKGFVRELEQGKKTLRLDKVNQILQLFGHEMGPVKSNLPSTDN
jgi:hypothetical protein